MLQLYMLLCTLWFKVYFAWGICNIFVYFTVVLVAIIAYEGVVYKKSVEKAIQYPWNINTSCKKTYY